MRAVLRKAVDCSCSALYHAITGPEKTIYCIALPNTATVRLLPENNFMRTRKAESSAGRTAAKFWLLAFIVLVLLTASKF
jgi:hypothetical protein